MISLGVSLPLILILTAAETTASSFVASPKLNSITSTMRPEEHPKRSFSVVASADADANSGKERTEVQMRFFGTQTVSTPPVTLPSHVDTLNEFFSQEEHQNLLYFQNDPSNVVNPDPALLQTWSKRAELAGGNYNLAPVPYKQNRVINMKAYLTMPGLQILSATTIGAKLILPNKATDNNSLSNASFPEYQFTLLDSQVSSEGSAPFVWLFNQIIKYKDSTLSFSRVRVESVGDDKIIFKTEASLEIRIHLPRFLLKVLSVNVEKYERQGSAAVQSLLSKELEPALLKFRDGYLNWASLYENSHRSGTMKTEPAEVP